MCSLKNCGRLLLLKYAGRPAEKLKERWCGKTVTDVEKYFCKMRGTLGDTSVIWKRLWLWIRYVCLLKIRILPFTILPPLYYTNLTRLTQTLTTRLKTTC